MAPGSCVAGTALGTPLSADSRVQIPAPATFQERGSLRCCICQVHYTLLCPYVLTNPYIHNAALPKEQSVFEGPKSPTITDFNPLFCFLFPYYILEV